MKRYLFISLTITFLLFILQASCQNESTLIKGRVIDTNTNIPVKYAHVYVAGTTIGIITDELGYFELEVPIRYNEMVISHVNYKTAVFILEPGLKEENNLFGIQPNPGRISELVVKYQDEFSWEEKYNKFMESLFGHTRNARKCYIINPDELFMYYNPDKGIFRAFSDSMLVIINNNLGYKIVFDMVRFEVDYRKNSSYYSGYPYFIEMKPKNKYQAKIWKKNRREAYLGSQMHFMRSIVSSSLKEEGFEILLKQAIQPVNIDSSKSTIRINNSRYVEIRNVEDLGIKNDDMDLIWNFEGKIKILYKEERPDYLFIESNPEFVYKRFQLSYLKGNGMIRIDQYGAYSPIDNLSWAGYMAWEKMGEMLPLDYNYKINDEFK